MLNIDGRINKKQMYERMPNKVNGMCRVQVPFPPREERAHPLLCLGCN